ncbi:mediator of RNA polymerase II transcription subunit 19a-like [Nymphaea colorata]|nr:mediator of RNA polymerase II transcription subunit 19a-like [Nymphaea colorata]XP_031496802.1 mediator of RNA polymerase II transcription subunit 19a-like [Nymphaea colorata]XP_031496803.1 mediator of RNA polymerase II transcription subunit 19a-like [Nymphaea colorata]
MDAEGMKFGRGPRELTGNVDLLYYYKLGPHHNFFCKRALPSSISGTHYLHNVVGDTQIRKGEGMELDQLFHTASYMQSMNSSIRPFDLDALRQAFQLRETEPIELTAADKGIPTSDAKSTADSKDKEKKHKKHKDKDREHKKHKHHHKDRSKDREKNKKDGSGNHEGGDHSKKHHEKKRRHDDNGDATDSHKHKKRKHREEKS